jgi:hypothetical protein
MSLNPFAPEVVDSLEEERKVRSSSGESYPAWMTYGDAKQWKIHHADIKNSDHHFREAEKHAQAKNDHFVAHQAIGNLMDALKHVDSPLNKDKLKQALSHHKQEEKSHARWEELHIKHGNKLERHSK